MSQDFVVAGAAAICAISIMHPVDTVKTRMQIQGERVASTGGLSPKTYTGVASTLVRIARAEGVRGLYRGLVPAYALQFSVTATRFGVYSVLKEAVGVEKEGSLSSPSPLTSFALAGLAGCVSAVAGNPFYAIKTRFQAQSSVEELAVGTRAQGHRLQPTGLAGAVVDVYRSEGFRGYWRGLNAFVPRIVAYGAVQLSSYETTKRYLQQAWNMHDGLGLHTASSFVAAALAVAAIQPFDFVAARMMNQPVDPASGRPLLYSSAWDCARKSVRREGWTCLLDGVTANYCRMFPYTVLVFVFFEQFTALVEEHKKEES